MPEPQQSPPSQGESNSRTIIFMVILSFVCALILSILASALAKPQEIAKELDRSKQMLIAARILDYQGRFLLEESAEKKVYGKFDTDGVLVPGTDKDFATNNQIIEVFKKRIVPELVDNQGNVTTFQKANIDENDYLSEYRKTGYYKQPLKLVYRVLPNPDASEKSTKEDKVEGYVIPINGYGLWDAIYGYLALSPDGDTVIGISWYDQKETPGLGAVITEPQWQNLFPGKKIFQESPNGTTDFKTAPLGIVVVKGKVAEVLGDQPKAKSAVDGMAGATLTGNGVTEAYRDVLAPYRPFLIKVHEEYEKKQKTSK